MKDMKSHLGFAQSLAPAARTASANGTGVDLRGFNSATVEVVVGAWTDGTHTPKLQDSDDNSTFGDVAAAGLLGSFTAIAGTGQQNQVFKVGYRGNKRYVRAVSTVSGATTGAVYGMNIVRAAAHDVPLA